nr:OmpA family protein [Alphaproteobacteria bacterium]
LNKIAKFLNGRKVSLIRVEGHTDSVGSADYNQRLSEQRAETVKNWLENNLDIEPTITTVGHGPRKPVAPNTMPNGADNPEGRQKNRRVEIFIPKK